MYLKILGVRSITPFKLASSSHGERNVAIEKTQINNSYGSLRTGDMALVTLDISENGRKRQEDVLSTGMRKFDLEGFRLACPQYPQLDGAIADEELRIHLPENLYMDQVA